VLTRRERRELERLAAPAEVLEPVSAAPAVSEHDQGVAELTDEARLLVSAELDQPDLETVVIKAPSLALPPEPAFEQVPSDVAPNTTTTAIVLPSRAALRAQLRAAQASDEGSSASDVTDAAPSDLKASGSAGSVAAATHPKRSEEPGTAATESVPAAASAAEPERVLTAFVPRTRASAPGKPAAAASARSGHHRMRMLATKGGSIIAMSFVALMAVATSIPAEALLSSSDVQAAAMESNKTATHEPAQTINLAGTDTITVEQDSYQSQSIAEAAAASGIRLEDSFSNNPNGTIQWPFAVGVHVGDQFGYRNCAGCSVNHGGQDFNPGLGAPIQSIADGVVSFTEDGEGSLGVHMVIDHMIDGKLVSSVYAHMIHGSMLLKTGDVVKVGQVIGQVGSTGMSTGPHLHFEIRLGGINGTKVDPLAWLYANTN